MTQNSMDDLFDVLGNRRRRLILAYLRDVSDGVTSVDALAEHVSASARSNGKAADDRASAVVALHHKHLPRLHDYGVLEYDPRSKTVRYDGDEPLEAMLDSMRVGAPVVE